MDITNLYCSSLIKGIEQIFEDTEYELLIMDSQSSAEKEKRNIHRAIDLDVTAFIFQPIGSEVAAYKYVEPLEKPIAIIDRVLQSDKWLNIVPNNYELIQRVCQLALEKGYTQAVVFTEPVDEVHHRVLRTQAIKNTFQKHQVPVEIIELNHMDQEIRAFFSTHHDK